MFFLVLCCSSGYDVSKSIRFFRKGKEMKKATYILFCSLILCPLVLFGCGKKADEGKPISEVKAEAEQMDVGELKAMVIKYKDAIVAKEPEIRKLADQLKEIPIAKMTGPEAKELQAEMKALSESVSALQERFQVYYDKLKEKGGDLSGLEM